MIMSTRSMSANGMELVSVRPSRSAGASRRPFISTRLRLEPKPRKSIDAPPFEPLFVPGPIAGIAPGSFLKNSSIATGWVISRSSAVTV